MSIRRRRDLDRRALWLGAAGLLASAACGGAVTPADSTSADATAPSTPTDGGTRTSLDAGVDGASLVPDDAGSPVSDASDALDSGEPAAEPDSLCGPAGVVLDGGCGDPQTDPHNCGGCGRDCDGGMCEAGVCAPLPPGVVATGQYLPTAVAIDSANVYWFNAGVLLGGGGNLNSGTYNGAQILQCAIAGCGNRPTVLATLSQSAATDRAQAPPSELAIDDHAVYWADGAGVHACAKGGCGCAPETLSGVSTATAVAVSPAAAYFDLYLSDAVDVCPLAGCPSGPTGLASNQIGPMGIVTDTTRVFWTTVGGLWQCPLGGCDGGATRMWGVPITQGFTTGIALDATNVYWTQTDPTGGAYQCAKAACASTLVTLASGRNGAQGIASDGTNVYWADSGGVVKCAVGGCGGVPTVVAASAGPAVAVDATHLAFTELAERQTDGRIVVIAK